MLPSTQFTYTARGVPSAARLSCMIRSYSVTPSLWVGEIPLGASFVAGIIASLTPCVFPMVPITVAIFGATESKSRARGMALSGTFVLGIAALFTPLGVGAALSGSLLGSALANPWVVTGLAVLFFALAASMFGAFESKPST